MAKKLNPKEALVVILNQDPDLVIHKMWNYSFNYYLLFAMHDESEYFNDPYYLVDKHTGQKRRFSSAENFRKFFRVTNKEPLVSLKEEKNSE